MPLAKISQHHQQPRLLLWKLSANQSINQSSWAAAAKSKHGLVSRFAARTYLARINKNRHERALKNKFPHSRGVEKKAAYLPSSERCTLCVCTWRLEFFPAASSSEKFNYARPHKSYSASGARGGCCSFKNTNHTQAARERERGEWVLMSSEWMSALSLHHLSLAFQLD